MFKGGYKIIDLKNNEIKTAGTTIAGVYAQIEAADVPILLCGIDDQTLGELKPRFVQFDASSTDFVCEITHGYEMKVTDDDLITIAAYEEEE